MGFDSIMVATTPCDVDATGGDEALKETCVDVIDDSVGVVSVRAWSYVGGGASGF